MRLFSPLNMADRIDDVNNSGSSSSPSVGVTTAAVTAVAIVFDSPESILYTASSYRETKCASLRVCNDHGGRIASF